MKTDEHHPSEWKPENANWVPLIMMVIAGSVATIFLIRFLRKEL